MITRVYKGTIVVQLSFIILVLLFTTTVVSTTIGEEFLVLNEQLLNFKLPSYVRKIQQTYERPGKSDLLEKVAERR